MIHAAALLICLLGFASLACATDRQQDDLFGRSLSARTTIAARTLGAALLVSALALLVSQRGWSMGLVQLSGHTSAAAALVYGALIARQRLCG